MRNLSIGLESYQDGAGIGSQSDVTLLNKALEVGYIPSSGSTSGDVLKVESLERTLKDLEYKEQDIAFWMNVPKLPAFSTVEEYNRLIGIGDDTGGFFAEGGLPEEVDTKYQRVAELVKYIGLTKSVTHQAQLVSTNIGDLKMHAAQQGTRWILRRADKALFSANADIVPEEFNGFLRQQRSSFASLSLWDDSANVIDMRGKTIKENDMEQGSEIILNNHGVANLFLGAPSALTGFVKQYRESKFIQPNSPQVTAGVMGQRVKVFESQFATINLGYDKFMRQTPRKVGAAATHSKAPSTPTPDGLAPVVVVSDASAKFGADHAGDYFVGIAAKNKYGESSVVQLGSSLVTVANGEAIDAKFASGGGSYEPTAYVIYRSEKNPTGLIAATDLYPVAELSADELAAGFDGATAGLAREKNRTIPDTTMAILIENDLDVWSFKQLAPLMKMELARLSTADRFMVLLYGTPQLYAPLKMVIYKNIGTNYVA